MLKLNYFLTDFFILSAEKQPIKSSWRKIEWLLHYERGFYVLYEKRPVMGKFKKPVFDEISKCYRIQWSDMAYLTESIVVDKMYVSPKD